MSRFERFAEPAKPKVRTWDLVDVAVLLGLGLIVAGMALVYTPAAFIAGGLALVALGIFFTH